MIQDLLHPILWVIQIFGRMMHLKLKLHGLIASRACHFYFSFGWHVRDFPSGDFSKFTVLAAKKKTCSSPLTIWTTFNSQIWQCDNSRTHEYSTKESQHTRFGEDQFQIWNFSCSHHSFSFITICWSNPLFSNGFHELLLTETRHFGPCSCWSTASFFGVLFLWQSDIH